VSSQARRVDGARLARRWVRGALLLLVPLIVLLVIAGAFATHRIYTDANDRLIKQAGPVFAASEDVLVEMLNEETAVRGYVITGDPATLGPYRQGKRFETLELNLLTQHRGDDPSLPTHLAQVKKHVRALQAFFANQIALVRSGPAGRRRAQERVLDGKANFDAFRAAALALDRDAGNVIKHAQHRQHDTFVKILILLIALGAVALAITLWLLLRVPDRLYRLYRGEQEARQEAERSADASRALAHVGDSVVLLGADGRVRYWNPAAAELFGIDGAALGRPADEALPALFESAGWAGPTEVELGGRKHWLVAAQSEFDGGRVIVMRDVTEDYELERMRSEFVATAAHELRTPLAAVYGAVRTVRREDVELSDEMRAQLLTMIERESERLGLIVDQLLVSAQLDRNQMHLNVGPVDAGELCKEVVESAGMRTPDDLRLVYTPPSTRVTVAGDRDRLRQVLANLLDNAIKYSPDGGRVEVRASAVNSSGVIEVSDQGIGIPTEGRERIFEKFYRLDPNMTRGVGGSGLGLYISRELVRAMHGSLTVESALGRGSTFRIVLPGH
jgi:signal transduction histidine kinase